MTCSRRTTSNLDASAKMFIGPSLNRRPSENDRQTDQPVREVRRGIDAPRDARRARRARRPGQRPHPSSGVLVPSGSVTSPSPRQVCVSGPGSLEDQRRGDRRSCGEASPLPRATCRRRLSRPMVHALPCVDTTRSKTAAGALQLSTGFVGTPGAAHACSPSTLRRRTPARRSVNLRLCAACHAIAELMRQNSDIVTKYRKLRHYGMCREGLPKS